MSNNKLKNKDFATFFDNDEWLVIIKKNLDWFLIGLYEILNDPDFLKYSSEIISLLQSEISHVESVREMMRK
ncbi:MAG: hypothetical protein ACW9W4_06315 [Candidatus Nitrosopumilus sp. bin_7KS]